MREKGTIALTLPVLLFIVAAFFILIYIGVIKNPFSNVSIPGVKKEPSVTLQKEYQNPFDSSSQYVNPFSTYKNPFDQLK